MKNFFIMRYLQFSLLFLLAAGLVYSCSSRDLEPQDLPGEAFVLHASYAGGAATKTEFGDRTTTNSYAEINWSEGDAICLFYNGDNGAESSRFVTQQQGHTADFPGDVEPQGSVFLGLYPYDQSASADLGSSSILTTIPSSQYAYSGKFDPNALLAVGKSSDWKQMAFYNVCSGLCFTLKDGGTYSQIVLRGNNSEKIAGAMNVSLSNPASPVASPATQGAASEVFIIPAKGATFAAGTEYYIMLKPGTFSKGFSVDFYKSGESNPSVTRTCTAPVEFKRGVFACITQIDKDGKLAAIREGTNLAANGEPANCYIVSYPGSYKFPLVAGNDPEHTLTNVTNVAVLWETDNTAGTQTVGSIIKSNVAWNRGFVYFDTPSTLKDGNALIAAYHGNTIVWSWHIWVCSGYNAQSTSQTLQGKNKAMMDRNLGALSASAGNALANGLFYQWGRKDPFPGTVEVTVSSSNGAGTFMATTLGSGLKTAASSASTGTVDYVVAHPDTFLTSTDGYWLKDAVNSLWGIERANNVEVASKSIYDPCPSGWKVPRARVMSGTSHDITEEAWSNVPARRVPAGLYLTVGPGVEAWYPNNGYISMDGRILMVGQYSCYWSCSPYSGGLSYVLEMSRDLSGNLLYNLIQYGKLNGEGHSVRCIEDK